LADTKLREKEIFTSVLFCRHGVTDYPEDRFYTSELANESGKGPGLSGEGQLQAQRLGRYLAGLEQVESLYVSPTLRTRQTMEPIARKRETPVVVLPDLIECKMGQWEGRSAEEIRQQDAEGWRQWKADPVSFTPPGGESLADFSQRIAKVIGIILEREAGRRVLVVTHAGPIRVATAAALGIPLQNCKRLVVPPGSVTQINYTQSWPNLALFGYQP